MLKKFQQFSPLTTIVALVVCHIAIYFSFRLVLFYFVEPHIIDRASILDALYIGMKFDGRYAIFTVLPLSLALLFPFLERKIYEAKSISHYFFTALQTLIFAVFTLIHIVDLGVYFYLQQRLDMGLVDFIENPAISAQMVWQSYPVIWICLGFGIFLCVYFRLLSSFLKKQEHRIILNKTPWKDSHFLSTHFFREIKNVFIAKDANPFSVAVCIRIVSCIFLFIVAYGQISSNLFPLRWSNAYLSADKNVPLVALHPVQNLYDTMHVSKVVDPHFPSVIDSYARMASYLGMSEQVIGTELEKFQGLDLSKNTKNLPRLDYTRYTPANNAHLESGVNGGAERKPLNVVLLMIESLTTPRSSLPHGTASIDGYQGVGELPSALDLEATPFLAELMRDSLYYSNFYANARTTARGIFSTLTGIPDINVAGGTSSRNPNVVDQQLIFNEFDGYQKYYLIGGNANWANIRGLFQNNISELKILEENYWDAPNVDVWGISDLALLRESVTLFNESEKPFIAFIQTAGFHRPYTIPSDNEGFVLAPTPSQEAIDYWGFEHEAEYQSLRFVDYGLRKFFERARKEPWFEDTVFVIFGDHGITKTSYNMSSGYLQLGLQAWHTPLFIYSPKRVIAGINPALHSQGDIFPTLASLAGIEYKNTTLGRNILEEVDGMFVPKEFSKIAPNEYVYNKEKDKALENRVYIMYNEGITILLLDEFGYRFDVAAPNKGLLFNLAQEAISEANLPTTDDFMRMRPLTSAINLFTQEPELAEVLKQKTLDFYHSAKYLLQNNKK